MISTKNIIYDLDSVPEGWVFEYYLKLSEKLSGQNIKMKSIFSPKDKIPSMFLYLDDNNQYRYKDFSSGNGGDRISLVKDLLNLPNRQTAVLKILDDYTKYITDNNYSIEEFTPQSKYRVNDYEIRHWNNLDQKYWSEYFISSKILEYYNVHPLKFYSMAKEDDPNSLIKTERNYLYGYFREDGTLYKIYQPKVIKKKFIKVTNYIQGKDQLNYDKPYLVITSSLKDLMTFRKLNVQDAEAIAPDSENTIIPDNFLEPLIKRYKKVFVLFDNDEPGIMSAKRYEEKYGFPYIVLDMEKDLSDSVKKYGIDKVKETLFPILKEKI